MQQWYPVEIRHTTSYNAARQTYEAIYAGAGIRQRDSLYLWCLGQAVQLRGRAGERVLDVSCGEGRLVTLAQQAGFRAVGIDFSRTALHRNAPDKTGLAAADALRLPFADEQFDMVFNIGSLEHYENPAYVVREMARVLHSSGVALLLLPNTFGLFGNIAHVLRHGEVFDDRQPVQRYASRASWQRLLEANGLLPLRVMRYEQELPRTWPDLVWMLRHPRKVVRALLGPLVPVNLSHMLIFICRRKHHREPL